jgi:adenylylsulfate kinase-like enzyme
MNTGCSILIITGPVGAGKTTIAESIFDLLSENKTSCAVIDFDRLTAAYPPPVNDRFNFDLGIANLKSILPNYLSMGIKIFIIPTVVESREEIEKFKELINETDIFVIRLSAVLATLHKRLEKRETGKMLNWHKKRAKELIDLFAGKQLENVIVDTENKSINSITEEVLKAWPGSNS